MRPAAVAAYAEAASAVGNASSLHGSGRRARRRVEESRESLAHHLGCRPSEVVFTSGGTEADNLAVLGLSAAAAGDVVAVGATEHHSVLDAAAHLATDRGGRKGRPRAARYARGAVGPTPFVIVTEVGPRLALVATMLGNNEIGTLNDVADLAAPAREVGPRSTRTPCRRSVASPSTSRPRCDLVEPFRPQVRRAARSRGAAHRPWRRLSTDRIRRRTGRDLRSGSVDVPGVVAMATALEEAVGRWSRARRLTDLREAVDGVRRVVPGDRQRWGRASARNRQPHLPGCSGESLILLLDAAGIRCSTGSACTAGVAEPSHVLLAAEPVGRRPGASQTQPGLHEHRGGRGGGDRRALGRGRARPCRDSGSPEQERGVMRVLAMGGSGLRGRGRACIRPATTWWGAPRPRAPTTLRTGSRGCCSREDAGDARRVADMLGIPFYVWDFAERFRADVIDDFVESYAGRDPEPLPRCNERIKFEHCSIGDGTGLRRGGHGHYARLSHEELPDGSAGPFSAGRSTTPRPVVRAGSAHPGSWTIRCSRSGTPVSPMSGRGRGRRVPGGLKPDSHDICFIPSGDASLPRRTYRRSAGSGGGCGHR